MQYVTVTLRDRQSIKLESLADAVRHEGHSTNRSDIIRMAIDLCNAEDIISYIKAELRAKLDGPEWLANRQRASSDP